MSSLTRSMNAGSFRAACHIWPEMGSRAQRSGRGCAATGYSKGVLGWAATITRRQWSSAAHCGISSASTSDRRASADAARLNAAAAKITEGHIQHCVDPLRVTVCPVEAQRGAPVVQDQDHVPLEVELVELDIDGCMPNSSISVGV